MRLNIESIRGQKGASFPFSFDEDFEPFEIGGEVIKFLQPVSIAGTATNAGASILLQGLISSIIQRRCSRCLSEHRVKIETSFMEEYVEETSVGLLDDERYEDAHRYKGYTLDIADEVLKSILVDLPMKALCSEDCRGICPRCGKDLNSGVCNCSEMALDPRLEQLREWFRESEGGKEG